MGRSSLFQGQTQFALPRAREQACRDALQHEAVAVLAEDSERAGDIMRIIRDKGRPIEQLTLDELFECWGWSLIHELAHETDEIIDIELFEEVESGQTGIFDIIAPFVVAGSYITLEGTAYGTPWEYRYGFTGTRCVQLESSYPPCSHRKGVSYMYYVILKLHKDRQMLVEMDLYDRYQWNVDDLSPSKDAGYILLTLKTGSREWKDEWTAHLQQMKHQGTIVGKDWFKEK